MKLLVQARKDGYNVLYPKPTPTEFFQFAGDIRSIDNNSGNFLGKYIYSIALASGGCIFTKHIIVQDVQREGLGNVGFSVFIPNVKELPGNDVKTLLDVLLNKYRENYCPDFYLVNKQEEWTIFEEIANKFENRLQHHSDDDVKNYQQGTGEAAFIYYSDDSELQKYFDAPYQKEYRTYKQVLFVEERLKDAPENPLNAIRHDSNANLTEKIDLSKRIILRIRATDIENGDLILNYKLRRLNDKNVIQEKDTELIFKNEEINRPWQISIEHSDYVGDQFEYHPKKHGNIKDVKLKKKQDLGNRRQFENTQKGKVYRLKYDKNMLSSRVNVDEIPETVQGYPQFKLDARSGYKFIDWKHSPHPFSKNTVYYEAIFEKIRNRNILKWVWILVISIVIAILAIIIISKLLGNSGSNEQENLSKIANEINYVNEIELNLKSLKLLKSSYCNSTLPTESTDSVPGLLQRIFPFVYKDDAVHSQLPHSLPDYCLRINNAIVIREAINSGQIDLLIGQTYSEQQQSLEIAINSIENTYKKQIGDTLLSHPVSKMNLDEIADLILKVQKGLREQIILNKVDEPSGDHIDKDLQPKRPENNLVKEFWVLVKKGSPNKDEYTDLVLKYYDKDKGILISNPSNLDQAIINFLLKICYSSTTFGPYINDFNAIPILDMDSLKASNNLNTLKSFNALKVLLKN